MFEQKLKRAVYSLYAVGAIKIATLAYSFIVAAQAIRDLKQLMIQDASLDMPISLYGDMGMSATFSVMILVFLYFVIQDLKKLKAWAWVGAIVVFLLSAPGFAIPACVFGLISLFDEDVRTYFLGKLDIKI